MMTIRCILGPKTNGYNIMEGCITEFKTFPSKTIDLHFSMFQTASKERCQVDDSILWISFKHL